MPSDEKKTKEINEFNAPEGQSIYDDFLSKIKQIESSGGKNTAHKVMEAGIHAGQAAIGGYGIMPNTARDVARKITLAKTTLGETTQGKGDLDDVKILANASDEAVKQALSNPETERKVARLLAQEVHLKQGGDPERAAYAWTMGSNLGEIPKEKLESHPYVAKFRKLKSMIVPEAQAQESQVPVLPKPLIPR